MSRRAPVAVAILAAIAVAVTPSHAAGKACKLVTDAKSDTFGVRSQDEAGVFGPQEDGLDILSADLAADAKVLTAVVRVVKLAKSAPSAPAGLSFRMQFAVPGLDDDTNLYVDGRTVNGTDSFTAGSRAITANVSTKLADAKGVFDLKKNEVRISVPLAAFKSVAKITKGTSLMLALADGSALDQTASRVVVQNPVTGTATAAFADVAQSTKSIRVGAPSCVVPGR